MALFLAFTLLALLAVFLALCVPELVLLLTFSVFLTPCLDYPISTKASKLCVICGHFTHLETLQAYLVKCALCGGCVRLENQQNMEFD